jgi:hypothetical protein
MHTIGGYWPEILWIAYPRTGLIETDMMPQVDADRWSEFQDRLATILRLECVRLVWFYFLLFVVQLPKDFSSEEDAVGTQKCVAFLEDIVDIAGFQQSVPGGLSRARNRARVPSS